MLLRPWSKSHTFIFLWLPTDTTRRAAFHAFWSTLFYIKRSPTNSNTNTTARRAAFYASITFQTIGVVFDSQLRLRDELPLAPSELLLNFSLLDTRRLTHQEAQLPADEFFPTSRLDYYLAASLPTRMSTCNCKITTLGYYCQHGPPRATTRLLLWGIIAHTNLHMQLQDYYLGTSLPTQTIYNEITN